MFNRAVWSAKEAARVLLRLLVAALVPDGTLVLGVDEALERRYGRKISAKGIILSTCLLYVPSSEVVVNGGPSRKVVREHAALAATSWDVEDGVEDLARVVNSRSSMLFGSGQARFDVVPFGIG